MSERIHALAQQLLGKPTVEECSLEEVKDLARNYPYFAPAQFLLLQKLRLDGSPEYEAQLQRAVLYYHNPLEFEYFINSEKFYTELPDYKAIDTTIKEPEIAEYSTTTTEESDNVIITEEEQEPTQLEESHFTLPVEEAQPGSIESADSETYDENETEISENDVVPEAMNEHEQPLPRINLGSMLKQAEEQNEQPAPGIVFEPYHTVDYFASQGIKPTQEEVPKDKFSKQLRSFTQWLKVMKRLPAAEIQKNIDPATEVKVLNMASDSVHESEVVTEAMAEVWLKQGNIPKAIEIYNKLSLLEPSKKAFFAAKIEQLKNS